MIRTNESQFEDFLFYNTYLYDLISLTIRVKFGIYYLTSFNTSTSVTEKIILNAIKI